MSPLPPAAKGKMIRVSGPDSALAIPTLRPADSARPPATNSRRFMVVLPAIALTLRQTNAPRELNVWPGRAKQRLFRAPDGREFHDRLHDRRHQGPEKGRRIL